MIKKYPILALFCVAIILGVGTLTLIKNTDIYTQISGNSQLASVSGVGSGLIAHWAFDEGSGRAVGDLAGLRSTTIGNANVWSTTDKKVGSASLKFGGTDEAINLGNVTEYQALDSFSVGGWYKFSNSNGIQTFISKSHSAAAGPFELWSAPGSEAIIFDVSTSCGAVDGRASVHVPPHRLDDGEWHHVIGVYDKNDSKVKIYLDGILGANVGAWSGPSCSNSTDVWVGRTASGRNFNGLLDDMRFYNRALSSTEVGQLCAMGADLGNGGCPNPPTTGADQTRPVISISTPTGGLVSGSIPLIAAASDNVSVSGVQFKVTNADGTTTNYGSELTSPPYSIIFHSNSASNGAYTLSATARDEAGNMRTSTPVSINISNIIDVTPPVISNRSNTSGRSVITMTWNTDELANSKVVYGITSSQLTSNEILDPLNFVQEHSVKISKLTAGTRYYFKIVSSDRSGNTSTSTLSSFVTDAQPASLSVIDNSDGDTLLELPNSALWNSVVSFRPGNGEIVELNPPRFSWPYLPLPAKDCLNIICAPQEFVFQVAASEADLRSQTNLLVNERTWINAYNFLPPLQNGQTYYWWVGYIKPKSNTVSTWTLEPDSFEITPYTWTAPRQFRVALGATTWDRSNFADESYLSQKAAHPHLLFDVSSRAGLYRYLQKMEQDHLNSGTWQEMSTAKSWQHAKQEATRFAQGLVPRTVTNLASSVALVNNMMSTAFVYQLTKDADPTDPMQADEIALHNAIAAKSPGNSVISLAEWFTTSGQWSKDTQLEGDLLHMQVLGYGYDWLYDELGSVGQGKVRRAINAYLSHRAGLSYAGVNAEIPTSYIVRASSPFIIGHSHEIFDISVGISAALATYADDDTGTARRYFDFITNYMVADPYMFAGGGSEGPQDQGKGYSNDHLFAPHAPLGAAILFQIAFPDQKFNQNPFWKNNAEWWMSTTPVGFTENMDPWGDTYKPGRIVYIANNNMGRNLSYFLGNGKLYKHYLNERASLSPEPLVGDSSIDSIFNMSVSYYAENNQRRFTIPTPETDSGSKIFPADGWATACSLPTNNPYNSNSCFTNGAGLIFKADPGSGKGNISHANYGGLSYQMWAYGVPVTSAGDDQLEGYSKYTEGQYGILVDGYSQHQPHYAPNEPFYSRLTAFKETSDYVYFAGDATKAYRHKAGGSHGGDDFDNAPTAHVNKVQRHMLFVKGKYWVVFDDLEATRPSKFSFVYHVPWLYDYASQGQCTNAYPWLAPYCTGTRGHFLTTKKDTLSFDTSRLSFSYDAGNIPTYDYVKYAPVKKELAVKVKVINSPSTIQVNHMQGATPGNNVRTNPIEKLMFLADSKGVYDYRPGIKDYFNSGDDYPRPHALWFSNAQKSTKFHFMSVIFPQEPGRKAPLITRYGDDFTAKVEWDNGNGTTTDIISFNPDTAPSDTTLLVDVEDLKPLPVVDDSLRTATNPNYVPIVDTPTTDPTNPTITISKQGTGSGTITGNNLDIACSLASCPYSGTVGTRITLTASPEENSTFFGWSGGGCSGSASCTLTLTANTRVTGTFNTTVVEVEPLVITNVSASSVTSSRAPISWTTNVPATSYVEYGRTTSYGNSTAIVGSFTTSHSRALTGLERNTTYHYRVISTDSSGNKVTSQNYTLTTTLFDHGERVATNIDITKNVNGVSVIVLPRGAQGEIVSGPAVVGGLKSWSVLFDNDISATCSNNSNCSGIQNWDSYSYDNEIGTAPQIRESYLSSIVTEVVLPPNTPGRGSSGENNTFGDLESEPGLRIDIDAPIGTTVPNIDTVVVPPPVSRGSGGGGSRGRGGGSQLGITSSSTSPASATSSLSILPVISLTPLTKNLAKGSVDPQVKTVQAVLLSQGLLPTYIAGTFDKKTEDAVKAFQLKYKIISTCTPTNGCGKVGPKTLIKINEFVRGVPRVATSQGAAPVTFERSLSLGSSGPDVKALQIYLNANGFKVAASGTGSPGKESTYFGKATKAALIKFQISKRITPAIGIFGPKTRAMMGI